MQPAPRETEIAPAELPRLIPPADRTLPRMLARAANLFGTKPFVRFGALTWSFADALAAASAFGGALTEAGIRAGDRVAILCGNRTEFLRAYLGCGWIGAIAVPINIASRGAQLAHILANAGPRLLIIEAPLAAALGSIDEQPLAVEQVWLIDGLTDTPDRFGVARPMPEGRQPVPAAAIRPGDTVAVLYTSGTTGPSKGVCCPHAQYFWWGVNTARLLGIGRDDVLLTSLPLFHTNALNTVYQALLTGASLAIEPRFSASGFTPSLVRHGATVTYLLGAMVPILLSRPTSELDRAHRMRIALAPGVPPRFHDDFTTRFGIALLDGYGSTETNFTLGCGIEAQRPGFMGPVFDGFEAQVVDAEDNALPDGTPGELVLRAREPFAFATGYFGMPEKTVEAWRNLWFHTGDRVVREPDGYFRFIDRLKDAIRRRGENISSFEVEQALLNHPAVANAAVYPVLSELAEDEVMAAVVLHSGAALSPAALIEWCRPRLPYFAVPRFIDFVTELPATENGKIAKYRLRERGVTATTWDRAKAEGATARRPT